MATCEACGAEKDVLMPPFTAAGEMNGAVVCYGCWGQAQTADELFARIRSRRQSPAPVDADGVPIRVGDELVLVDGKWRALVTAIVSETEFRCRMTEAHRVGDELPMTPRLWRHSPPPEVKPSERAGEDGADISGWTEAELDSHGLISATEAKPDLVSCDYCCDVHPREVACGRVFLPVGLACALIEAMRRDFAILAALRPGMTSGDLAKAIGEPPPVKP
jgi:hypothetical protein